MIDIGINLMNKQFKDDREEVVKEALKEGVVQMIITGTSIMTSIEAQNYASNRKGKLYSTAGVHPHDAKHLDKGQIKKLEELLKKEEVVAVGECGLDFNRNYSTKEIQEKAFEEQLQLAKKFNKPLFLHERDAHKRFIEIMEHHNELIERSVVHCFTGSKDEVKDYIEKGFYIGVTGWICDERRGKELQEAVKYIPLDRVMIETDGPYLAPKNLKPRPKNWRNEPKYLPHIARDLARYMGVSYEELIEKTTENTKRFFKLK